MSRRLEDWELKIARRRPATVSACQKCGKPFMLSQSMRARRPARHCSLACRFDEPVARFWSRVNKRGPVPPHRPRLGRCWVWTHRLDYKGYGKFADAFAHRVSWRMAFGKEAEPRCLHKCDNAACVRPSHLFEGTVTDNNRDMFAKGRGRTPHVSRKYTEEQFAEVLAAPETESNARVAMRTGIHKSSVSMWRARGVRSRKRVA